MSLVRRLLGSAVWPFAISVYQRFELDFVAPTVARARALLADLADGDTRQTVLVDAALFLVALATFVWVCRALRDNWVFQWLAYFVYQVVAFVFFSYGALFSWQTMVFIALAYPELIDSARQLLFEP